MDLDSIDAVLAPRTREALPAWREGDAWLAGGTWLFSEPQPKIRRLIDLAGLEWEPLQADDNGLVIAATCTIASLAAFKPPVAWTAAALIGQCCHSFLASFKIWTVATVGGNVCMALPAGPMISLCAALDGVCVIWSPDGSERRMPIVAFVEGPLQAALRPGELLRSVEITDRALMQRTAFRRASLTPLGRSGVLLIGATGSHGAFVLTVTASTRRPVQIVFDAMPRADDLANRIAAEIPDSLYYDDVHGRPDWRRHMTFEFAEEIRRELAGGRT